ncbi:MAG: Na/Pi cotransporter family protein [Clostridia bacterium]|nr:Na/Pi cotransporter family protein [Clostridia bacterium]
MSGIDIAIIIVTLLGGLAFFLYGMNIMTTGLERMAGGKLESILKSASSSKLKGMALGCGVTAVIQSSSATTVMLVGLVGSGIMTLPQTVGMLMGSNIGTTITPWITGLSSLNGGSGSLEFLNLLKPSFFAPIIAVIGIVLIMFFGNKSKKNKDIGMVCLGFAILMQGMELMSASVSFLSEKDAAGNLLYGNAFFKVIEIFETPFAGIWLALLVGMVFTAIIQSSSAATGVLQILVAATTITTATGEVTGMSYSVVIPLILGINIGTCVTAVISSLGANSDAKRVAVTHLLIKCFAVLICMIPFAIIEGIGPDFLDNIPSVWGIATFHTLFNVISSIILFPATNWIMKLSYMIVKDKSGDQKKRVAYLDPILIDQSPAVAISECANLTNEMCLLSMETLIKSIENLKSYDTKLSQSILENEEHIDKYEDNLGTYLVKISSHSLSVADSKKVSKLLHTIGDFERLSDHAVNILKVGDEMNEKKISFSEQAQSELSVITDALEEIIDITSKAFTKNDLSLAKRVEPLEQVIDKLISRVKSNHIDRLQDGNCTIELGFILSDLLNNYERVSDHCSNIAVAIIETAQGSFETHEYLNTVKKDQNEDFSSAYAMYENKFQL